MNKVVRSMRGRVVRCKMNKTITVLVERRVKHSLYAKYMSRSKKYHVRDEEGSSVEGDIVIIQECRPLSKTVCFRLSSVVARLSSDRHVS